MAEASRGVAVGQRMARERERKEISLSAFSRSVHERTGGVRGTSRTALRNLENGRVDAPRKEVVEAAAEILDVDEEWLWSGREELRPDAAPETPEGAPDSDRNPPEDPPFVHDGPWAPEVARAIASSTHLARAPRPVRRRFWRLLRTAGNTSPSVRTSDQLVRFAKEIDHLVLRPLDLIGPTTTTEGEGFVRYASSLLEAVSSSLDEVVEEGRPKRGSSGSETSSSEDVSEDVSEAASEGDAVEADESAATPPDPPSVRRSPARDRRHRDGLTWRLM